MHSPSNLNACHHLTITKIFVRILCWNVRRATHFPTCHILVNLIRDLTPHMIILLETKFRSRAASRFVTCVHRTHPMHKRVIGTDFSRRILCLWDPHHLYVTHIKDSHHHITFSVIQKSLSTPVTMCHRHILCSH